MKNDGTNCYTQLVWRNMRYTALTKDSSASLRRIKESIAVKPKNGGVLMANNSRQLVPQARQALDNMKFEIASQVGVNLKQGYNGDLPSKQAGTIGGQMVKRMIQQYETTISGR